MEKKKIRFVCKTFGQQNILSIDSINMPSPNQTKKKMDHIFFNLFELDPEDEDDSIFGRILIIKWSKDGTNDMVLLPCKELIEM